MLCIKSILSRFFGIWFCIDKILYSILFFISRNNYSLVVNYCDLFIIYINVI